MNFEQSFDALIGHEGGYSNNPADPGGETMWGITTRVARADGYTGPMRDLPRDRAKAIYRRLYWDAVQAEQLPESLRFDVFDAAVNSGVKQASIWLQKAVGAQPDGVIGARTIAAARGADSGASARYNGARLQFMTDLATWPSFGKGWARRIASNLSRAVG